MRIIGWLEALVVFFMAEGAFEKKEIDISIGIKV